MKRIAFILALAVLGFSTAFAINIDMGPVGGGFGTYRSDFTSFTNRDIAAGCAREKSDSYTPLEWSAYGDGYICPLKLSLLQMDRDVFIRFMGIDSPFELYVNDSLAGVCMQSRGSAEMLLDPYTREGDNTLFIRLIEPTMQAKTIGVNSGDKIPQQTCITWQPMVHIEDFRVTASLDSAQMQKGVFNLEIAMKNSFNGESGPLQVWYELENAEGTLIDYSYVEMNMEPMSSQVASFSKVLKTVNPWSSTSPYLYKLVLKVRQKNVFTEYSAIKIGFRSVNTQNSQLLINGKTETIKGVTLAQNADQWSAKEVEKELSGYKKLGVNLLNANLPMPYYFYEAADKMGFYVSQTADINTSQASVTNLKEGDPNNSLDLLPLFLDRVKKIYHDNKNRTSIVAWNLGNGLSNGYNNQRSYLHIKELENCRPIWYAPAAQNSEWNTDLSLFELLTPQQAAAKWGVKEQPTKKSKKSKKR